MSSWGVATLKGFGSRFGPARRSCPFPLHGEPGAGNPQAARRRGCPALGGPAWPPRVLPARASDASRGREKPRPRPQQRSGRAHRTRARGSASCREAGWRPSRTTRTRAPRPARWPARPRAAGARAAKRRAHHRVGRHARRFADAAVLADPQHWPFQGPSAGGRAWARVSQRRQDAASYPEEASSPVRGRVQETAHRARPPQGPAAPGRQGRRCHRGAPRAADRQQAHGGHRPRPADPRAPGSKTRPFSTWPGAPWTVCVLTIDTGVSEVSEAGRRGLGPQAGEPLGEGVPTEAREGLERGHVGLAQASPSLWQHRVYPDLLHPGHSV